MPTFPTGAVGTNPFSPSRQRPRNPGMGRPAGGPTQGNASFGFGSNVFGGASQHQGMPRIGEVNYGAVAGITNYLDQLAPAQRDQASQFLRSQGLMGTYNGVPFDQLNGPQRYESWTQSGAGASNTAIPAYMRDGPGGAFDPAMNSVRSRNATTGQWTLNGQPWGSQGQGSSPTPRGPSGAYSPAANWGGLGTSFMPAAGGSGLPGMGGGWNAPGGSGGGTMGFPLEGQAQNAISGLLSNPSVYSPEQTAMLRNRALSPLGQGHQMNEQALREDAARRGLSPGETEANLHALRGQSNAQGARALQDFELSDALQRRQGLMGGLNAAQGLMGLQLGNEDSIRKYLALLEGNSPMFLGM